MSEKCLLYSVENQEMGTKAQPMFLSVIVSIMSLSFCRLVMRDVVCGVMLWRLQLTIERKLKDCRISLEYKTVFRT